MPVQHSSRIHETLTDVQLLLQRHRLLSAMTRLQPGGPLDRRDLLESLQERQNLAELRKRLRALHPADLAHILPILTIEERRLVWEQVPAEQRGLVLVELSAPIRKLLIDWLDPDALAASLTALDADDLAYLADDIPPEVLSAVSQRLDAGQQTWLHESITFGDRSVGALMSADAVSVRESVTVDDALDTLRSRRVLPGHTDRIFVVDARHVLRGAVPLTTLLLSTPHATVTSVMVTEGPSFTTDEEATTAASAFERYDLVSAPVVDSRGKLVGRLTGDVILDFLRAEAERKALERAGLSGEEDLFAPMWDSLRNRWPWLLVNVMTALVASRVIGVFAPTIQGLVALATLMPIVASIGGNTGNQTVALVIRGLALDQLPAGTTPHLLRKELTVGALNGLIWGGVMAVVALALYHSASLAGVMALALLLNLLVGAVTGVVVPMALRRAGRDPAQGASVLLTFVTDSMGFFIFLGLATVFLV
jgi:magnesium transporter